MVFVERDSYCLRLLRENITLLGYTGRAEAVAESVLRAIESLYSSYDLIFMGPPYKTSSGDMAAHTGPVLESLAGHKFLKPGGWIVAQTHSTEVFAVPAGLSMFRQEKYGDSRLSFFQNT